MSFASKSAVLFKTFLSKTRQALILKRYESIWDHVELAPPDAIFGVTEGWKKDKNSKKVNVGVGAYRDDSGKPYILPSVRKAEEKIFNQKMNHAYVLQDGHHEFCKLAAELAFGKDSCVLQNNLNVTAQSVSGTGALRLGAAFLAKFFQGNKVIYFPKPTWGNHKNIFAAEGFEGKFYRYYDAETIGLNFRGMREDISKIPEKSVILFHAVAHNPTGIDPTMDEWKEITYICKKRKLLVFFDMAYQGFASGDTEKDAAAVRLFVDDGHEIILAQSFSKNMGLYGQRVGTVTILTSCEEEQEKVLSQMKAIILGMYMCPPIHGPRIVAEILGNPIPRSEWLKDLKGMADRIISARKALVDNLKKAGSTKNWDHITKQIGMFCYTGLTPDQVKKISKEHSIYLTADGRISVAGVGTKNVEYLAHAMHTVTK
uniref:Aspartate aminotransferase n=1 Tax=Pachyrhynchus infernalis TaxID=1932967 RepID=A0A286T7L1_9CUCU|nr:glutamate oxaloacetate transaminase, mitochondrial-like [Pachyrhynchus infernalis]